MKIKNRNKTSTPGLAILALIIFSTTITIAQAPLRANGKIAFTSDRDGNQEIYVMNADGTNQTRLTSNLVVDDHPTWSPDGKKIAFLSQSVSGAFAIFIMNSDGTGKTEITPITVSDPHNKRMSWSPDGRQLAINHANGIDIVDADGRNRRFLTSGFEPVWSPDGSRILFVDSSGSSRSLVTIRPDGTEARVLASAPGFFQTQGYPDWSPDGSKIAFLANDSANQAIFIANSDGTDARDVIYQCQGMSSEGCSYILSLAWSPDGRKLVYGAYGKIYVNNQNGDGRAVLASTGVNSSPSWQSISATPTRPDFDGDRRADLSVFRPTDGFWYVDRSADGFSSTALGLGTDRITPADYDGDGKTDISVFRNGTWFWLNSSNGILRQADWGIASDTPLPADYTGDGRADLAVYRAGTWFIYDVATGIVRSEQFGIARDEPVAADYDGDGRTDLAVYRDGVWYVNRSSLGFTAIEFGLPTDRPVVGDYDGDGKAEPAVYRDGTWYLLGRMRGFAAIQWGISTDTPVPADYDGDGRFDLAVYRRGTWWILRSSGGFTAQPFGLRNDVPVPAAFLNQKEADPDIRGLMSGP